MNDRKLLLAVAVSLSCLSGVSSLSAAENTLTAEEKEAGFELLFNGRDFAGWDHKGNWAVEDGALSRQSKGGGLTYNVKKIPNNFELRFDWKVAAGSNSGVYYRPGQYEYQILDNAGHSNGTNPRTTAASLYFCMAPSRDATRPVGQWNQGGIVCQGSRIQHWLNGERVVDFDYADPKWADNVRRLRIRGANLSARGAFLHLQDHGDPVWFRSIRLREIPAGVAIGDKDVEPQPIPDKALRQEDAKLESLQKNRTKGKKE
jgi:hypothetical protein